MERIGIGIVIFYRNRNRSKNWYCPITSNNGRIASINYFFVCQSLKQRATHKPTFELILFCS